MVEIELTEPQKSICECCGKETTSLARFVHKDDNAHSIYYAAFSDGHVENGVIGVISLGNLHEEIVPSCRVAFGFSIIQGENDYLVAITDANESLWKNVNVIGRKFTREEALAHEWIDEVFHLTDHMVVDDPEIAAFFTNETIH
jgi:hypothetical protein